MKRQVPDLDYLKSILVVKNPATNAKVARLAKAQTVWDLKRIAKRRTPKGPFEYTSGAAEGEVGLQRAYNAWRDVEFHPTVLRDVSHVDTGWDVLGKRVEYPVGIAPTGFTRLMHAAGERAGAKAAQNYGVPFTLSTMGTTSPEEVRKAAPDARLWFQLYVMKERERSYDLVRRARAQGFDTLLLTVDTAVAGARHRDVYNGMSFPPQLTGKTFLDASWRPEWWFNLLTTEPLEFAAVRDFNGTPGQLIDAMFDPSLSFDDLAEIRAMWDGKIMIKGVQSLEDAKRIADFGVDGIQLSNHGGRQLDRAPVPFRLLPEVVREVGKDLEIHVDTGITSGADVVAAIAHGARYTQVGRAYLYGLMAGGEMGVNRMLSIITDEMTRVMQLLGVGCLEELEPRHVTMLDELRPRLADEAQRAAQAKF